MEKRISTFTIFTFLLFTVSIATIASDPVQQHGSDVDLPVLPTEKPKSPLDLTAVNEKLPESEQTQTFNLPIEPTLPVFVSRRFPIQRHSFDRSTRIPLRFVRRHPCRKFKRMFAIPTKRSYGNDMIVSDKTVTADLETIGDQVPMKWLEFKHRYGHLRHHQYQKKYEFDEEKMTLKVKKKKREHNKGGFMRRVRKFLKHTFD